MTANSVPRKAQMKYGAPQSASSLNDIQPTPISSHNGVSRGFVRFIGQRLFLLVRFSSSFYVLVVGSLDSSVEW